jgi:hypothetical protein
MCAAVAALAWIHAASEERYLSDERLYENQPLIFVGKDPPMMTDLELSEYTKIADRDEMELYFG